MSTGTWNPRIQQGATWTRQIRWRVGGTLVDTSGYTARMHVRRTVDAAATLIEFTTENGRITLGLQGSGEDQYNVKLTLNATDSSALDIGNRIWKGVYDLELSGGGVVSTILAGDITIIPEVTR